MTAIPPVTTVLTNPLTTAPPASENSAASFEALLDNTVQPTADAPQKAPPRLFSFVALGMFGRHGAEDAPGNALSLPQTPDTPATVETGQAGAAPSTVAMVQTASVATPVASPSVAPAIGPHHADMPSPARGQTTARPAPPVMLKPQRDAWKIEAQASPPQPARIMPSLPISRPGEVRETAEEPSTPVSAIAIAEGSVEPGAQIPRAVAGTASFAVSSVEADVPAAPKRAAPAQQPDTPTREEPDESAVALAVTDTDGALAITARSASESADEAVRIRRAVESVASEFGLDIGEFQLNGSVVEPASPLAAGGKHGNRTR